MNIDELVTNARERGTVITTGHKCPKCGNKFYYTREGRFVSSCLWCMFVNKRLPKKITEAVYKSTDGTAVYEGKACRNCGSREHLAEKAHGAKEGACYPCAMAKASSKGATHQINRLRQQIKHQTKSFVINSVQRSGTIEVSPADWSEHFLIQALFEDCKRLNALHESEGVRWEIGHNFPASGGGTEYRGKATIENLFLVRVQDNRSHKDGLPEHWSSKQVVWVGDLYDTISSREAAAQWRKRMGLDALTKEQISQQKQRESEQNARHYDQMQKLSVDVVESLNLALAGEDEYQALREKVSYQIAKINSQAMQRIKTARRKGESLFKTDGDIIEEGLHGIKARYRVVLNTMEQLEDIEQERRASIKSPDDAGNHNTRLSLIKRALLYWARDVIAHPKRDIEGFTHPFLNDMADPRTWGIVAGDDGRFWLCGWLYNKAGGAESVSVKEGRNAEYITLSEQRFTEQELKRKAAVTEHLKGLVNNAMQFNRVCRALSHAVEIPTPENIYDEGEIEQRKEIGRKILNDKLYQQEKRLDELRESMNRWHTTTSKGKISADEVEHQAKQWIEQLDRYQNEPKAPPVYNVEIEQALITQIKQELSLQSTPY
ncbi:hypothetical protein VB285_004451 [Salmonella enterica]|nr:hypothetical protein [Salmonella enterica]ELU3766302.1 hypothetical protein [Salmonella enterica]EMC1963993.1 hypothetical protein [Salmonella enterica]